MIFRRTERFLKAYRILPVKIQGKLLKALKLMEQNQRHPSLRVRKMEGHEGIWEARVDLKYRFTFHYEKDSSGEVFCVFRNVDNHDECLKNP
jgi:mRNA-degrading endonuclease RelE of RelBE toxin-antitoxin system